MNVRTMQKPCWTDHDAVAVLLFGIFLVSSSLIASFNGSVSSEPIPLTIAHLLAMLLPTAFAIALTVWRCTVSRCSAKTLFGMTDAPQEILRGLLLGIAFVPAAFALSYATGWIITAITGEPPAPQALMDALMLDGTPRVIAGAVIINAITLVPLSEEILYRGVLVSVIRRKRSTAFTVVSTALFFSLLHVSPVHIPALTLMGIGFASAYLVSGSLLTSIAMHAAFNTVNLLLAFWS